MKLKHTQSRKANIRNRNNLRRCQEINNAKKNRGSLMGNKGGMSDFEFIKLFFGRK